MAADKSYRVRLSTDVSPEHYDLRLEPDLDRFTFDGIVKVTCNVAVATDTVSVNTKELLIQAATFTPVGGAPMPCNEIIVKVKEMTSTFSFDEVLPVGKGVLEIKFRGTLNAEMAGFYRSEYTNNAGEKKRMAVTQFEAIDARRCFPCWDEPGCKAVFVVTMVYARQYTCLCNMPPSRREILPDGRALETFMPSPKMSTYLLAFCVGEYEFISAQAKGGTLCRIFCRPGMVNKCDFALQQAVAALDLYDDFFGVPYPLPKMDMIAIPDFAAGAMENWGLVTYREVLLLCDVKTVSAAQKDRICAVIAHELAHQWFGNLVTMEWWDDLWLNEGFANFMQTFAADALHPEWKVWDTYVTTSQAQALRLDALRSSHPIQVPIGKAEEVEEVFDAISYCKGGAVVRMIKAVIGLEKFQEGLKIYFQRHQYGNTETTDLWRAWSEASGKPIDTMMGSWTVKMGCPVLKVLNDPFEDGGNIEVEQSWFLSDGSVQAGDEEKVWVIPIFAGSDKAVSEVTFADQKKQSISDGGTAAGASWLKLNFGQQVPMRVLYPPSMIARLSANVSSLPVVDRIGLLSDTYALCKSGALEPAQLATLLRGFKGEADGKVWMELSATLQGLDRLINLGFDAEVGAAFSAFASTLVAPAFAQVGWDTAEGDDDNRKQLRATLVSAVAKFCAKDPAVASEAARRCVAFFEAPADGNALNADIRPAVLGIAMQGDKARELFDQLIAAHNKVEDNAIKGDIYGALGCAPLLELQVRACEWTLTDDVRLQDIVRIPMSVASSRKEGAQCAFDWIKRDFGGLKEKMGAGGLAMTCQHFVKISGAGFLTEEKAQEVKQFWESKPEVIKSVERALSQTLEGIRGNAHFAGRLAASELSTAAFWAGASV